jgi:ketosteroid isomerase-like protein
MNCRIAFSFLAVLALLVMASGCQQPKSETPSALTAEDVEAVGKTIDSAIETFVAKDIDRHMAVFDANLVNMEYDRCFRGLEEYREKHVKPEMVEINSIIKYEPADRVVRGHDGLAYVYERNIIEYQTEDGKTFSTDSAWASHVLEKQPDGVWKIVQNHFSGPMVWTEKET